MDIKKYLNIIKFDELLVNYILCLGLVNREKEINTKDVLTFIHKYLLSIGKYGSTGYLVNIYGLGSELSQAYCRYYSFYYY